MRTVSQRSIFGAGLILILLVFIQYRSNSQSIDQKSTQKIIKSLIPPSQGSTSFTDARDGETYKTVIIGSQIWMAENLRYNSKGSRLNRSNPNKSYGRLYTIISAQTACPAGWRIPTDREWDEVEMAHGMPFTFIGRGGWRGEHAMEMKSIKEWKDEDHGRNLLGFNILPAGYYFGAEQRELEGLEGLGYSAAFWSSVEDGIGYARFMFSSKSFVNKWPDTNNDSGAALSCRCIKD